MKITDGAIFLERGEVLRLCKPGEEANTCVWLMVGGDGFECSYYNRPSALVERWLRGQTSAQRDGCEEVKAMGKPVGYIDAMTLKDILGS